MKFVYTSSGKVAVQPVSRCSKYEHRLGVAKPRFHLCVLMIDCGKDHQQSQVCESEGLALSIR